MVHASTSVDALHSDDNGLEAEKEELRGGFIREKRSAYARFNHM